MQKSPNLDEPCDILAIYVKPKERMREKEKKKLPHRAGIIILKFLTLYSLLGSIESHASYQDSLIITSFSCCWRVARCCCLVVMLCRPCFGMYGAMIWHGEAKVSTCSRKSYQRLSLYEWLKRHGFSNSYVAQNLENSLHLSVTPAGRLSSAYHGTKITRSPVLQWCTANQAQLVWIKDELSVTTL